MRQIILFPKISKAISCVHVARLLMKSCQIHEAWKLSIYKRYGYFTLPEILQYSSHSSKLCMLISHKGNKIFNMCSHLKETINKHLNEVE